MGVYGLPWTPAISFEVIRTLGSKFWTQGPFGTKFKNLHFSRKTPQYGCLLSMDSAGPHQSVLRWFGPRVQILIWAILTKPHNMGVYGLSWIPAISFEVIWTPRVQMFGPRVFWNQNKKSELFSQNLTIWVSMDLAGLQQSVPRWFWPRRPNFGPRGLLT